MFFILNNEKTVLVADDAFLEHVGTSNIFLLAERFRFGDFHLDEAAQTCLLNGKTRSFTTRPIQTILGRGTLYEIQEAAQPEPNLSPAVASPSAAPSEHETVLSPAETEPADAIPAAPAEETETERAPILTLSDEHLTMFAEDDVPEAIHETTADTLPIEEETADIEPLLPAEETITASSSETQSDQLTLHEDVSEPAEPHTENEEILIPDLSLSEKTNDKETSNKETNDEEAADTEHEISSPKLSLSEPHTETEPAPEHDRMDNVDDLLDLIEIKEDEAVSPSADVTPAQTEEAEEEELLFSLTDVSETEQTPLTTEASTDHLDLSLSDDVPLFDLADTSAPQSATETPKLDYAANAAMIGITSDEYLGFLTQFIDESLLYKAGLQSDDPAVFKKDITSIKDASQLLHLPQLSDTLIRLESAPLDERHPIIEEFYGLIDQVRHELDNTVPASPSTETPETLSVPDVHAPEAVPATEASAPDMPAPEAPAPMESSAQTDTPSETEIPLASAAPSLSLETVETIPFDFSTQAASDELGLPESLVQEFVSDFIQQAQENIPVLEQAQRNGDIDTIQKTAHLLKGAASNLRIDPLAETLETLQYNESLEKVPQLLPIFVGQLKALMLFSNKPVK